ncbi:MAG: M48 family metallopeptidase [Pseudomonadota bacterium]
MTAFADFYDGVSARRCRVALRIDGDALLIERPETDPLRWPFAELHRLPDGAPGGHAVVSRGAAPGRLVAAGDVGRHLERLVPSTRPAAGRSLVRPAVLTALGGAVFLAALIFVVLPVLAGGLARVMDPEAEIALGKIHDEQARLFFGEGTALRECRDPAGMAAMAALTDRVAEGLELPYDLRVAVLDDGRNSILNAYAVAGGRITFFDTMLREATHPDEIAAVLAHEIGHVVNQDPVRVQLQRLSGMAILSLLLGDVSGGGVLSGAATSVLSASYSRDAEVAADRFAVEQLIRVGLPPSALARMFERLRERYGESTGIVAHFATHPQIAGRIEATARAGDPVIGAPSLTPKEWAALQGICD